MSSLHKYIHPKAQRFNGDLQKAAEEGRMREKEGERLGDMRDEWRND